MPEQLIDNSGNPPQDEHTNIWTAHSQAAQILFLSDADFPVAVKSVLEQLGNACDVSNIYVWRVEKDSNGNRIGTHGYIWDSRHPERNGQIAGTLPQEVAVVETLNILESGTIINSLVRDLSDTQQRYYSRFGIVSLLAVPLFDGQQFWGFITADDLRTERRWSTNEEVCLQSIGTLFAAAFRHRKIVDGLKKSDQWFHNIVQVTDTVLWEFDLSLKLLYVSDRFKEYTGIEPADQAGKPIADWIHPDDFPEAQNRLNFALSNQSKLFRSYEFRGKHADGSYTWFRAMGELIYDNHGDPIKYCGVINDIQRERKSQERFQQTLKTLEQTNTELASATISAQELVKKAEQANVAKSMFLATMSHEIRTPLNGVIGLSDLLLQTELSVKQLEYVQLIRSSGRSLLFLINDILDFSKIEAGKLEIATETFNLHDLSESAVRILAHQAGKKKLELCEVRTPNVPRMVYGDVNRLRQILINLIGNAVKFTDTGGVILFLQAPPEMKNGIRFTVQDTGIGIQREQIDKIFDAFSQVDSSSARKFGGTGLGLSISSKLVNLMRGTLTVESEVGKGSTFHVDVPLEVDPHEDPMKIARRYSSIPECNVLIAAQNAFLCDSLEKQLTLWGIQQIKSVYTAEAVLNERREAAQEGNPFTLIILDNSLQKIGKENLIFRLYQTSGADRRKIPIILLQSLVEAYSPFESGLFTSVLRLDKPVNASALFDAMLDVLGKSDPEMKERRRNSRAETIGTTTGRFLRPFDILVAEDNKVNQIVIKEILRNYGLMADIVSNGRDACDAMEQKKYGLVLMDCQMPEMDGYEATRIIRNREQIQHLKRVPIIALTANAAKGDEEKCLAAGMDAYCSKPINPSVLFDLLRFWTK